MKSMKRLLVCIFSVLVVGCLAGCTADSSNVNSATDTTKDDGVIEEILEDTMDGAENLADDVMDGAEEAVDDVKDGVEDAADDVKDGVEDVTENGTESGENTVGDTLSEDYMDDTENSTIQ